MIRTLRVRKEHEAIRGEDNWTEAIFPSQAQAKKTGGSGRDG